MQVTPSRPFISFSRLLLPLLLAALLLAFASVSQAQEGPALPGRVEGQVSNLSPDGELPADADIHLFVLKEMEPQNIYTGTVAADGSFAFDNVPFVADQLYIATLEYKNVSYGSNFAEYDGLSDLIQLDIEIYEPTTQANVINIGRLHIIIDFTEEVMQVTELYIFDNLGEEVFVGPSGNPDDGTLELPLPAGAINPQVQRARGDSMIPANNIALADDQLLDTIPVRPGDSSQQLMLVYEVPYTDQASISHPLPYAANSVSLLLPDLGLTVESDQLADAGMQSSMGTGFVEWSAENMAAGSTLAFEISGEPDLSSSETTMDELPPDHPDISQMSTQATTPSPLSIQAGDNSTTWAIGIAGLLLAVGVLVYFQTRRPASVIGQSRDSLMQALVDLDTAHAAGEISKSYYELERERLKSELRRWYQ